MAYTKRTCHSCGIRDIQPNMVRTVIQVETGSSNTGMNKRTVVGALLGSKQSSNQLGKYLLAPSKRVYKRNKTVWQCEKCSRIGSSSYGIIETMTFIMQSFIKFCIYLVLGIIVFAFLSGFFHAIFNS